VVRRMWLIFYLVDGTNTEGGATRRKYRTKMLCRKIRKDFYRSLFSNKHDRSSRTEWRVPQNIIFTPAFLLAMHFKTL
jgi:hypothetical protein